MIKQFMYNFNLSKQISKFETLMFNKKIIEDFRFDYLKHTILSTKFKFS